MSDNRERLRISSADLQEQEMPSGMASYFEFSEDELYQKIEQILTSIAPPNFIVGDFSRLHQEGDLGIRVIRLPDDSEERKRRVAEIAENGCDRTDPTHRGKATFIYDIMAKSQDNSSFRYL